MTNLTFGFSPADHQVTSVEKGGVAERAGVHVGDEVVSMNGQPISGDGSFNVNWPENQPLRVDLKRDGQPIHVELDIKPLVRYQIAMSDANPLIPVFVPTLANVFAFSERTKGSPLTKAEAEAIRDKCACIMMETAHAEELSKSRGYVDVNPDNCWADWHRLRPQMTGGYLPRIILCIPGGGDLRARCEPILSTQKIEHEFRPHDEKLVQAFKSSSMTWPCFEPEDFAAIDAHQTVLYVLSENFVPATAAEVGVAFLKLGRQLLDAGGFAIKCDSAGISHSPDRWLKFEKNASLDAYNKWSALFLAFVVHPIGSSTDFYSCGMHLLGAADMIVSKETIQRSTHPGETTASAAARLFRAFGVYLMAECSPGAFTSGHTFSMTKDTPRFRVSWEPCTGFAEDDYFFNPFGRWRFGVP